MITSRREMLRAMAAVPFALGAQDTPPPNILFVLSDDHSAPYLGAYGATWMATPNLDQFAREGLVFERAFTAAPQCVPSRTALMTGRSPVAARMGRFSSPLPPDIVTTPEVLRTKGYYTGVCGRYFHLDGVVNAAPTTADVYERNQMRTWKNRVDYLNISSQGPTPQLFEQFLEQAPKGRPWFFWINYNDPHHPWDAGAGKVDPAKIKLPPHLPDLPGVRDDLARYCGEVERADRSFGEAFAVLRKSGQEASTLVVFMGDNGMAFPHGKGSLYDPGLNVPLMARWPGHIKPGVTRTLISGEDVAATFMDAGGAAIPKGVSGRSFFPLLTGGRYQPREYIFGARLHHGNSTFDATTKASEFDLSRCVRSSRYKLIYNLTPEMEYWPVDSGRDAGWQEILAAHKAGKLSAEHERAYFQRPRTILELYDLEKDPGELHNLAGQADLKDLQQTLMAAMQEKMITDYDYVPPVLNEARPQPAATKKVP
ncbi:MAG: sulfatase [Candidatus Solibacter sp.]|nr:sulfatase [Candidatus Solibacter sp.]